MPPKIRSFLVALSLSNLCFFNQWEFLDTHTSSLLYQYENASPYPATYWAMLLNVFIGAFLIWGVFRARESKNKFIKNISTAALALVVVVALNSIRVYFRGIVGSEWFSISHYLKDGLPVALIAFATVSFISYRRRTFFPKLGEVLLTLFIPFAIFNLGWTTYKLSVDEYGNLRERPPLAKKETKKNRVVWIIFDTMEQRSTFTARPKGLALPEIDRLKEQSFYATNVYSPGARTQYSLASYITAQTFDLAIPLGGNDLQVRPLNGSTKSRFSTLENVFDRARKEGLRTGMAGWFHPYCRMLGHSFDVCNYHSANMPKNEHPTPALLPSMGIFWKRIFSRSQKHVVVEAYEHILKTGSEMASNPDLDFVMIHMPVPHLPGLYDRKTRKLAYISDGPEDLELFWGNMVLSDLSLGKLRSSMQKNRVWDKTTVLMSSDHWWWWGSPQNQIYQPDGTKDFRIPFVMKLANQKQSHTFTEPFNAVLSGELLLEILLKDLDSPEAISQWIRQNKPEQLQPILETNIFG